MDALLPALDDREQWRVLELGAAPTEVAQAVSDRFVDAEIVRVADRMAFVDDHLNGRTWQSPPADAPFDLVVDHAPADPGSSRRVFESAFGLLVAEGHFAILGPPDRQFVLELMLATLSPGAIVASVEVNACGVLVRATAASAPSDLRVAETYTDPYAVLRR